MHRRRRAIALAVFCTVLGSAVACDDPKPGQPGDGAGSPPAPQAGRLSWSQAAPSPTALQSYSFILFIDGARATLSGATCSGAPGPTDFECSGTLPALSSGRRVLEMAVVDSATGLESPRSASLTVDVGSDGRPRLLLGDQGASGLVVAESAPVPTSACAAETPTDCFAVDVVARDIAPVRRLLPLPDGRLLVLLESGAVTMLPSGTSERPDFGSRGAGPVVDVADVAADPDFSVNRFLYFATTAMARDGRRTVSVVRVRELADRVGEPATIVADLPAAPGGNPAMSIGPDRRIYLAMPGPMDDRAGYGGHVLRFTRDGRAAGNDRNGSPVLAQGRVQPTRLVWDAAARLLIASAESSTMPVLAVVPVEPGSVRWPTAPISVAGTIGAPSSAGLSDLAAAPPVAGGWNVTTIAMAWGDPKVLLIATVTAANPPQMASKRVIPLGSLTPATVAFEGDGDLLVAATGDSRPARAILLRLRRISPQRVIHSEVRGQGETFKEAE